MTVRPGLWSNTPTNIGVPTEADLANFGQMARSFPAGVPCYAEDTQTLYIWDPQDITSPTVVGQSVAVFVNSVQIGTWHAIGGGTAVTSSFDTVIGVTDSLKSTIPHNNIVAGVKGYSIPGDNGGGLFYWDPTTTATNNDITIIRPTLAIVGAWVRIYSGPIDLAWAGALPDCFISAGTVTTAGSASVQMTDAAFIAADVGKSIVVPNVLKNVGVGTVTTVAGSRGVLGAGGTVFRQDFWIGSPATIAGVPCVVTDQLTGTMTAVGGVLTGVGTKFGSELWTAGGTCFIQLESTVYKVTGITSDVLAAVTTPSIDAAGGVVGHLVDFDNTHMLVTGAVASAGGQAYLTANYPLIGTIVSVTDATHVVTSAIAVNVLASGGAISGYYGTDVATAFNLCKTGGFKDVECSRQGSYLNASGINFVLADFGKSLHRCKGVQFYNAKTVTIDTSEAYYTAESFGPAFFDTPGALPQYTDFDIGAPGPRNPSFQQSITFGIGADGSIFRGIFTKQHIYTTATIDPFMTAGKAAFKFGLNGGNGSSIAQEYMAGMNYYTLFSLPAANQQSHYAYFAGVRDDGYANFSPGPAINIENESDSGTGAVTAVQFEKGTLQGFRQSFRNGGPVHPTGADTLQIGPGKLTCENYDITNPYFIMHWSGVSLDISGMHQEGDAVGSNLGVGVMVGSPGLVSQNVRIHNIEEFGNWRYAMVLYGFDGLSWRDNGVDLSASDATHPSAYVLNLGSGSRRVNGYYYNTQKNGRGANSSNTDFVNSDYTGFQYALVQDEDAGGVLHPKEILNGTELTVAKINGNVEFTGNVQIDGSATLNGNTTHAGGTVDSFGINATLTSDSSAAGGAVFNWFTQNGNYFFVNVSDSAGIFLRPTSPSTGVALTHSTVFLFQQNYWDGAANQAFNFAFLPTFVTRIPLNAYMTIVAGPVDVIKYGVSSGAATLAFFNAAPTTQIQLTNSTGDAGAAAALVNVTTAGLSDPAKVNANFAALLVKLQAYGIFLN